ncbi:MAG: sterol desaturase family protein [Rhodoferax sp.]|nr:sterol desaturase family protein [Rhodoferax sp.]
MKEIFDTLLPFIHIAFGPDPDWKQVFLQGLTPLFLLATLIEWRHMKSVGRGNVFKGKDVAVNMLLGVGYQLLELVWWALFISALLNGLYALRIQTIELTPLSFLGLMFGLEFCYYWFHRGSHRIRWFWCAHVVHHSGENMNTTTAMRQSMFYGVNLHQFFWAPMLIVGYAPWAVMLAYGVNLGYQYFIHTQSVGKLHPWLEAVLNTPSHHRAHHGRNDRYIDKNFGGMLIIWDRLFGTFEAEAEEDPVDYGIPRQPKTQNLWELNTHEWRDMFTDALRPGPVAQRLKHIWGPPEWTRPGEKAPS